MNDRGWFLVFEGPDGAGKTTGLQMLREQLVIVNNPKIKPVFTREPGGTIIAEKIRSLLLTIDDEVMSPTTEMLLFAAARAQHIDTLIKPALQAGKLVISDRFYDSTYAYQGAGHDRRKPVLELERFVLGDFKPDVTLFFQVDFEASLERLNSRIGSKDRLDLASIEFKRKLYQGYQERLQADPERFWIIDANQDQEGVRNQLRDFITGWIFPRYL